MYVDLVQKGLTVAHNEHPDLVQSPGPIDGTWGTRTAQSLEDFSSTRMFGGPWSYAPIIVAGDDGAPAVQLPSAMVTVLDTLRRRYVLYQPRSAEQVAGAIATSQGQHGAPPSTADIQAQGAAAISSSDAASSLPTLSGEGGIGTAGKVVLGLLVFGGVVGVIYWARKGKRRR